jgi:hypothetical protein
VVSRVRGAVVGVVVVVELTVVVVVEEFGEGLVVVVNEVVDGSDPRRVLPLSPRIRIVHRRQRQLERHLQVHRRGELPHVCVRRLTVIRVRHGVPQGPQWDVAIDALKPNQHP